MGLLDDPENNRLATMLGMGKSVIGPLYRMSTDRARDRLAELQDDLPARFKAAAFQLHPDRNPGNEAAADEFARLCEVRDALAALSFVHTPAGRRRVPKARTVESIIKVPTDDELRKHGGVSAKPCGAAGIEFSFYSGKYGI